MLTKNIKFKNFLVKSKNLKLSVKDLKFINKLKKLDKIPIKSLKTSYKYSYRKN